MDYADRLDPAKFEDEESVGFGVKGSDPQSWAVVPETLVSRLVSLGAGYQLHYYETGGGLGTYSSIISFQTMISAFEVRHLG